jgi:transcriptional regulator with XRE-family HTH domain
MPDVADHRAEHDAANERLREALRGLMKSKEWGQVRVSEELGFAQQTISTFLSRRSGASLFLAFAIAKNVGLSLEELIEGVANPRLARGPTFDQLPGWAVAVEEARKTMPYLPPDSFEAIAQWRGELAPLRTVNAAVVGALARTWWESSLSAAAQSAAEQLEAESHTRRKKFTA